VQCIAATAAAPDRWDCLLSDAAEVRRGLHGGWLLRPSAPRGLPGSLFQGAYRAPPGIVLRPLATPANDALALAHEVGHAMHFSTSAAHNPPEQYAPELLCTEMVAAFHELVVLQHAQRGGLPDMRLQQAAWDMALVERLALVPYRQAVLHEFECELYGLAAQDSTLPTDAVSDLYELVLARGFPERRGAAAARRHQWMQYAQLFKPWYFARYAVATLAAYALRTAWDGKVFDFATLHATLLGCGSTVSAADALRRLGVAFGSNLAALGASLVSECREACRRLQGASP